MDNKVIVASEWYGDSFAKKLKKEIEYVVEEGTEFVWFSANNNVPVDSGALKNSGRVEAKGSEGKVIYGEGLEYAPIVEFVTGPFLRRSGDENKDMILNKFTSALSQVKP